MFLEREMIVRANKPEIRKPIAENMWLELYVADSGEGKKTWAIAVISTLVNGKYWKTKYDSGRLQDDLNEMANECLVNIRFNWDINYWRRTANYEISKRAGLFWNIKRLFSK